MTPPTLPPLWLRWLAVLPLTALFASAIGYFSIPGHVLLGALAAGVVVAIRWHAPTVPRPLFGFAQAIIGCLVAASFDMQAVREVADHGILFVAMVLSVFLICAAMGCLLARKRILPGTTAIWGTSPGAASIMTIMSGDFGADSRLVALMQYSRVVMVTFAAIGISSLHGHDATLPQSTFAALQPFNWTGFIEALVLCLLGTAVGIFFKWHSGAILFPLIVGSICKLGLGMDIAVPWWLLLVANLIIGWGIGFRFTVQVLVNAVHALPSIIVTFLGMIILCGAVGVGLGWLAGIDPLTAYLATSPGGMDVITLIAVSVGGNAPLIMAVQLARFLVALLTGPRLAAYVAKKMQNEPVMKDTP
ncbi:MAG: AbrB family transcriptional regulator [Planctomycetaceae bacterium]|nr:AbrB family transcriptional regulator [Planctomycetaceae bacterium]